MLITDARAEVAETCRRSSREGLVRGTSGNVSVRAGDLVAISPGTLDYDSMTPADVPVVDLDGNIVEGDQRPSSELGLHLALYRERGAGAVVHTHSEYASVLSTQLQELPPIHYMIVTLGGKVPVVPYSVFGGDELAEEVTAQIGDGHAAILGSHGALTKGATLAEAYKRSVTLEWLCALYFRAIQLGNPRLLTSDELQTVAQQMKRRAYTKPATGGDVRER